MNHPAPSPDDAFYDYLGRVELATKKRVGVVPEDVLFDLKQRFESQPITPQSESPNGLSDEKLFWDVQFGSPQSIAQSLGDEPQPPVTGKAPGWRICCTVCGRSSPADRVGITRIAARSFHKYVAGRCQTCKRVTSCRLLRDVDRVTLTESIRLGKTPAEIRRRTHHPWIAIAAILVLVLVINLAVWWMVSGR